jgi:hypothetical protein
VLSSRTFYLRPFPKGGACGRGRVNTLVIFTITAGLAHEPQKERDPRAVFIGDPSSGPQNVIVRAIDTPRVGLADKLGSSTRLADSG